MIQLPVVTLPKEWRERGRKWFIVHVGILRLGIPTAILGVTLNFGIDHDFRLDAYASDAF